MDFIIARFIKMLTENYKLDCDYIKDHDKYVVVIKNLDDEAKRFFLRIKCNIVTGCTVQRNKNGDVVKLDFKRANKKFVDDFGPNSVRIIFTDDNYGERVNVLEARLREFYTSNRRMEKFYAATSSL